METSAKSAQNVEAVFVAIGMPELVWNRICCVLSCAVFCVLTSDACNDSAKRLPKGDARAASSPSGTVNPAQKPAAQEQQGGGCC